MYFTERRRYAVGIITLLCVVFIWVGSSFLMNVSFRYLILEILDFILIIFYLFYF
jgi:hypothetical protein